MVGCRGDMTTHHPSRVTHVLFVLLAVSCVVSASSSSSSSSSLDPLLLRVARGKSSNDDRTPVWMMRQAGRHMAGYRDLCKTYPTFRERSETHEVSVAISCQPVDAYGVDGCILFSDILTPLPAMGVDFSISEGGGISIDPIRTSEECQRRLQRVSTIDYERKTPFVRSILKSLREKVPSDTTVLGFVGLPFTLGSYLFEGMTGVATEFRTTKFLTKTQATLVHEILTCLALNIGEYACYQITSGAQVIQVFDSWAGHVDDGEYDQFVLPYQQQVIARIKEASPETPIIIYMAPGPFSTGGKRLLKLAESGAHVISVDHTVDMAEACRVLPKHLGVQGNLDPQLLRDGPLSKIKEAVSEIMHCARGRSHIMNLGHGIMSDTPEQNAAFFVQLVKDHNSQA